MRILEIASEVVPFAKTGGLADVVGTLPVALESLGHSTAVLLPLYRQVRETVRDLVPVGQPLAIPIGDHVRTGQLWKSTLPGSAVPVYFLSMDDFYQREGLYGTPAGDYPDNAERFIFLCRAALEAVRALGIHYDVLHCHDWQTGLVPVYLKTLYAKDPAFAGTRSVLTLHNLGYQGVFWHWDMKLTGLDWSLFNWRQLEFWGKLNLLKGGIVFADALTTVSPRYAQEIRTREFGCGLEGVLQDRSKDLHGIINGIDNKTWDPARDRYVPAAYTARDTRGKAACKAYLQRKCGLPALPHPLFGFIGRLAEQKGVDLLTQVLEGLLQLDLQVVILGSGDDRFHKALPALAAKHPKKLSVVIGFNEQFAHEIYAGADAFLMPSRWEPCGLGQLYALRYGTVPIVRETGGLADTVVDATEESLAQGTATGFVFRSYTVEEFRAVVARAVKSYEGGAGAAWKTLVRNGMAQDWSWTRSAREYVALFEQVVARK